MSVEFFMTITFELIDTQQYNDVEAMIEYLDLEEVEGARALIKKHTPDAIKQNFKPSLGPYSDYNEDSDVFAMYQQCYYASVEDMSIKLVKNPLSARVNAEGLDDNAADFGSAFLLLLKGLGVKNIRAQIQTDYWQAQWTDNKGLLSVKFKEFET